MSTQLSIERQRLASRVTRAAEDRVESIARAGAMAVLTGLEELTPASLASIAFNVDPSSNIGKAETRAIQQVGMLHWLTRRITEDHRRRVFDTLLNS